MLLRRTAFALLTSVVVASADESSFVQVKAHEDAINMHEVSAAEVKAAIANIGDGLKSITVPGKARQMAIDALMKSVSGSEKLDPETADVLNNISSLLNDILDEMHAERNEDQQQLDGITDAVAACNGAGLVEDGNLETTVTTSAQTHVDCRAVEANLFDVDAEKCLALTEFLQHLSQPNCQKPEPTQAAIEAWNNMLHQGASWFTSTKTNYEPKRDDCLASTEDLKNQVEQCNRDQTNYENHFCEWHLHRTERCDQLEICYNNRIEAHNNLTAAIKPIADQRVREAGVIVHVQCLIDKLVNEGITDHEACDTVDQSTLQDRYNNTYPDPLPTMDACSTTEVSVHPGRDDWYNFAYSSLSANTPAVTDTGINCHTSSSTP